MQIGMIGLGRMGADMVRRLANGGHDCIAFDSQGAAIQKIVGERIIGASSVGDLVARLSQPRVVWMMVPAGVVDQALTQLAPLLAAGDIVIDGGNSYYRDDMRRAVELKSRDIHYVDVGTSGGVAGLERGYCLMIGGEPTVVGRLDPIFATLAPGGDAGSRITPVRPARTTAEHGYLHCGSVGAGHFVKMVHNGIEYGVMAAYAEGFNILHHANVGARHRETDAETTPLRHPECYRFNLDLPLIAEVWRHGSVISSWLLDLTAAALRDDPDLKTYAGRVSDSGEGRWTLAAAIDEGVPTPVIGAALFERFQSQGEGDYADKLLSAMRKQFGGHVEKKVIA
jgi:6-phosphogluconate dehydrogenase